MKAPWVQKAKLQTREPYIATNPLVHPSTKRPNHQPSRTSLPTQHVLQQYSSIRTAGLAWVHAEFIPVSCWAFHFFTILHHPGEREDPSLGGQRTTLPARRVGHGTRYAPGTKKGCCVEGTWRHSETTGGRVEVESRSCFFGV